ncbi:unnamed protein product [Chrysodeixis includens]|uniref:Uncharacterized protein n=1 Tax=Chrysodeixis includens TaxID=689277 RepID=A0A9N8L082_CHRIL|nr:unnamed protein product [Chrysodeixis includens]
MAIKRIEFVVYLISTIYIVQNSTVLSQIQIYVTTTITVSVIHSHHLLRKFLSSCANLDSRRTFIHRHSLYGLRGLLYRQICARYISFSFIHVRSNVLRTLSV